MWLAIPAFFLVAGGVGGVYAYIKNCQNNQNLKKKVQMLQIQLQQAQMKLSGPKNFQELHQRLDKDYVELVSTLQLTDFIKKDGRKHICFIGPTSSGKSTLVNELFECKQKVGLGSTTKQVKPAFYTSDLVIWDAPGVNKKWSTYDAQCLNFFKDLTLIFVLYTNQVQQNSLLIRILQALNKDFVCVRTKCDLWNNDDQKSISEWLMEDRKQLERICQKEHKVIATGRNMRAEILQLIL